MDKKAQIEGPSSRRPVNIEGPSARRVEAPAASRYQGRGLGSFAAVKKMQEAILHFAGVLASTSIGTMQESGRQNLQRGDEAEYLGGSNPFGNFLVEHYMQVPPAGKQFISADMPQQLKSQTGIPDVSFRGVVNTIARIGTPGSEKAADGVWGEKTNNALKQIHAVGSAVLHFADDLGAKIVHYSQKDLDAFGQLIPASYTDAKGNESKLADEITKHINMLTYVAGQFKKGVLENKQYKDYITQGKSLGQYEVGTAKLTPEEQKVMQSNPVVPGLFFNRRQVSLKDISSPENFKDFLTTLGVAADDEATFKQYVASAKNMLTSQQATEQPGY